MLAEGGFRDAGQPYDRVRAALMIPTLRHVFISKITRLSFNLRPFSLFARLGKVAQWQNEFGFGACFSQCLRFAGLAAARTRKSIDLEPMDASMACPPGWCSIRE